MTCGDSTNSFVFSLIRTLTVGAGISPARRLLALVDCTTGKESHLSPKKTQNYAESYEISLQSLLRRRNQLFCRLHG